MNPEFLKELLALKKELGPIAKTSQGHRSKYADLAEVHRAIDDKVHEHGFVLTNTFRVENGETLMDATLWHQSGFITSTLPLNVQQIDKMNYYQALGSAITYERRYALMALLSLPAEDDDGHSAAKERQNANGNKVAPKTTRDAIAAFFQRDSLEIPVSADPNTGELMYAPWADKFVAAVNNAPSAEHIDKLCGDNLQTITHVKENCAAGLWRKIDDAVKARHKYFADAPAQAAAE